MAYWNSKPLPVSLRDEDSTYNTLARFLVDLEQHRGNPQEIERITKLVIRRANKLYPKPSTPQAAAEEEEEAVEENRVVGHHPHATVTGTGTKRKKKKTRPISSTGAAKIQYRPPVVGASGKGVESARAKMAAWGEEWAEEEELPC